ncbi:exopolysaccharide biosynthesis protein [Cognatilysobacter terrigena]|uniref:exopolysaccharide biosynthesis protein n=1 Tax=Cognatilysobacter terrigena TaxID=2488749 RepID=UPI001060EEB8|nr:exopolysaccharide biosynthesis protein [Lysobacter terrigena]
MRASPDHADERGTRALLDGFAKAAPDRTPTFAELLTGLGDRAFGMLLIAAAAPAFIPVPGLAGGLSGPLVMIVGVQLLLRLRRPWLPRFIGRRSPKPSSLLRLRNRLDPWLARLERVVRPRYEVLLDHWMPGILTGLLVLTTGVLLSLPIPFTNYVLGLLVLLFALAFLERDGVLMGVAWTSAVVALVVFGLLSGSIARAIAHYL